MILRLLTLLAILISPFSSYAQKTESTPEEQIKKTGINFNHFFHDVLPLCMQDELYFLGCMNAFDFLARNLEVPCTIETETATQGDRSLGELVQSLPGGLELFAIDRSELLTHNYLEMQKIQREQLIAHVASMKKVYQAWKNDSYAEYLILKTAMILLAKVRAEQNPPAEAVLAFEMYNHYQQVVYDPHTRISPLELERDDSAPIHKNEAFGIGIHYTLQEGKFSATIANVTPHSAAMKAGLKWRDQIVTVDGIQVDLDHSDQVINAINGSSPTHEFTVLREGRLHHLKIKRKELTTTNLEASLVKHFGVRYGYIAFKKDFMDSQAPEKLTKIIQDFERKKVKGLILDLQDNLGGSLNVAINIASLFLGKKVIVTEKALTPEIAAAFKMPISNPLMGENDAITTLPLVTLINSSSASASEILAGALQDYGRSWILGDRSFGKGSVQTTTEFLGETKIYKFKEALLQFETFARFYLPSQRSNQITGIIPNFWVSSEPGAALNNPLDRREESLYINALPPEGDAWQETRVDEVNSLNHCRQSAVAGKTKAEVLYDKLVSRHPVNEPELRILAAEEILTCEQDQNR